MERDNRRLAEGWIDKADKHLRKAEEYNKSYGHASEVVEAAQICVELSVKAVFKLLDIEYPYQHGIEPNREQFKELARQLRAFQNEFEVHTLSYIRLPRLLFLLNFWSHFYTVAKYGYDVESLAAARELFGDNEAALAVENARECLTASRQLIAAATQLSEILTKRPSDRPAKKSSIG